MNQQPIKPPRWAERLLRWYCRPALLEDLQGDLNEYFERNVRLKGARRAKLIYVIDVIKFCRLYTVRKPLPLHPVNNLIVFQNYFKTSLRNIKKNKLFSSVNIAGLAVSMCVGLLLVALIAELKSYDNFHKNARRIFRVNNTLQGLNGPTYNYVSTSVLAGRKIKESVSGVEEVVIMRRGFYKDLRYKDKIVPLRGFWADESFFKVFSFPMISGNVATALKEPNSIVMYYNFVDTEYIPLQEHKIIAGENFKPVLSEDSKESSVIINWRMVKWMQLTDPHQAIGEMLTIDGQKFTVIGVVEDFHHERVNYPIQNFAFRYSPERLEYSVLK